MSTFETLTSHLGAGILLGTLYVGWLLRVLSRRMGEVVRMPAYYRAFDIGNASVLIGLLSYIFQCSASLTRQPDALLGDTFTLTAIFLPLTLGLGIILATALIYWGWLFKQR